MKIFFLAVLLACSSAAAQPKKPSGNPVKLDSKGNFVSSKDSSRAKAVPTGRFYIDKAGALWPVYKTESGKLYALRTSKAGRQYKFYLRPDTDTTDWEGN